MNASEKSIRHLILILGDQLDRDSAAFDGFDKKRDAVWMAEADEETTYVWCHKMRIAFFFSAMRHFRDELKDNSYKIFYTEMPPRPSDDREKSLAGILRKDVHLHRPQKLIVAQPGDWRVLQSLKKQAREMDVELEIRPDRHFFCSIDEFNDWADGRKNLVLEYFYRDMRKRHDILLTKSGEPVGGEWNFDKDNRESFGKQGPKDVPQMPDFKIDETTQAVHDLVEKRFGKHPGSLEHFNIPVTRRQALYLLRHFIDERLPLFGRYEDAMWTDHDFLFHSRLSAALNLKLLNPRECVEAALEAYENKKTPIAAVEGFVRQLLGWREFIRGVYWNQMPKYAKLNALDHQLDVPPFYWTGETKMECVRQAMRNVIQNGYAHHIQRLMVLGLFAQLYGVHPYKFHEWHMAMYLDAIDWVSLPNALGMSQYGDGGIVGSKPYCASGNYINRMSNYCKNCPYDLKKTTEDDACPFNALYWDFLDRHYDKLKGNRRMNFQIKNLEKKRRNKTEISAIRTRAESIRLKIDDI